MTHLSFEGRAPSDDEIAAITTVILSMSTDDGMARAAQIPAWTLAGRFPQLCVDDVRALAHRHSTAFRITDVVR